MYETVHELSFLIGRRVSPVHVAAWSSYTDHQHVYSHSTINTIGQN